MAKKISRVTQGKITPAAIQLSHIGTKEGEYVVIEDDEGRHGTFLSIYTPTKKEDKKLLEEYLTKGE